MATFPFPAPTLEFAEPPPVTRPLDSKPSGQRTKHNRRTKSCQKVSMDSTTPPVPEPTPPSGNLSSSTLVLGHHYTLEPSPGSTNPSQIPMDSYQDALSVPHLPMNISSSTVSHHSSHGETAHTTVPLHGMKSSMPLVDDLTILPDDNVSPSELSAPSHAEGAYIMGYPGYQEYHYWLESHFLLSSHLALLLYFNSSSWKVMRMSTISLTMIENGSSRVLVHILMKD